MCVRICRVLPPHGPQPVCVFEGSAVFYSPMLLSVCVCACMRVCWGRNSTFLIIRHCQNESSEQDRMDGASRKNSFPDQVKEKKRSRGKKCAVGILPGCKHLYIPPGEMAFHLRSCLKQESMV